MIEADAVEKAISAIRHIEDQIGKRQYLNAASASTALTAALLAALSAVLKAPPLRNPAE